MALALSFANYNKNALVLLNASVIMHHYRGVILIPLTLFGVRGDEETHEKRPDVWPIPMGDRPRGTLFRIPGCLPRTCPANLDRHPHCHGVGARG